MTDCCSISPSSAKTASNLCPVSRSKGKKVELITLKALLKPESLEHLKPSSVYMFCPKDTCEVVYFNSDGDLFKKSDVKVPVFQKDKGEDVPACYCFGWTRKRIKDEIRSTRNSTATSSIKQNVKDDKCGCEVNNPQGSCCLGNVNKEVKEAKKGASSV